MATIRWPSKDPGDTVDYSINAVWELSSDGTATADTISSVDWTVPAGLTKVSQAESGTTAVVWLSGGTAGNDYTVGMTITSAGGRIINRDIKLKVEDL